MIRPELPVGKASTDQDGVEVYIKANWKVLLLVFSALNLASYTTDSLISWFLGSLYVSSKPW